MEARSLGQGPLNNPFIEPSYFYVVLRVPLKLVSFAKENYPNILYDSIYIKFKSWQNYSVLMKFGRVVTLRVYGLGRAIREPSFWCGANTLCGDLGGRVYVCKRVYGCKNVSSALLFVL